MKFIFDILLFLILALVTIISTCRGFVRSIWASVVIIGSFFLSYAFGEILGNFICTNYIMPIFTEYTFNIILGMVNGNADSYNISELVTSLPDDFVFLAEKCGADLDYLENQFSSYTTISEELVYDFANTISLNVSQTVSNAIGFIAIFIVSVVILLIIGLIIKIIVKIPTISWWDKFLGFILGILKGLVIIFILCIVAALLAEFEFINGEIGAFFKELINSSYIFKFFRSIFPIVFINVN